MINTPTPSRLYCLDFDETLLNTDRLRHDMSVSIQALLGDSASQRYEELYEEIRLRNKGVSIPLLLKELRDSNAVDAIGHAKLADLIKAYPFQEYVYPGADAAVSHLRLGGTVILFSDGDEFFQAQKIYATSIASLVDRIVVVQNKIEYFSHLEGFYPVDEYVFIDDKASVLDAAHEYFGNRAITVHVRQGRYADVSPKHRPSISIDSIDELLQAV